MLLVAPRRPSVLPCVAVWALRALAVVLVGGRCVILRGRRIRRALHAVLSARGAFGRYLTLGRRSIGLYWLLRRGLLVEGSGLDALSHVGAYRRVPAAHRRSSCARRFDLGDACGVNAYGDDGSLIKVVFYGDGSAGVFQVLLDHGKARARPSDIALLLSVRRGYAKIKRSLFISDARPLVRKADGGSCVEHRDDWFHKPGVDKVFHNLADHHEGDVPALFFHAPIYGVGDFFQVCPHVVLGDDHHAWRGEHVIVHGYSRCVRVLGRGLRIKPCRRGCSI